MFGHHTQVARGVITRVVVNVMYNLIRPQFAAQMGFHNQAMDGIRTPIWANMMLIIGFKHRAWVASPFPCGDLEALQRILNGLHSTPQPCAEFSQRKFCVLPLQPFLIPQFGYFRSPATKANGNTIAFQRRLHRWRGTPYLVGNLSGTFFGILLPHPARITQVLKINDAPRTAWDLIFFQLFPNRSIRTSQFSRYLDAIFGRVLLPQPARIMQFRDLYSGRDGNFEFTPGSVYRSWSTSQFRGNFKRAFPLIGGT